MSRRYKSFVVIMAIGMAMGVSGCASAFSATVAAAPSRGAPRRGPSPQLVRALYTLYPYDVLDITVYGYPELSKQVRVSSGGGFVYPPLGTVHAAGLTVAQLEQQLTQQLRNGRLTQLQVGVTVKAYHNRHVHILGAVRSPGVYTLPDNASLLDLIAQAHGLTAEAEPYVLIYRGESASRPEALALVRHFQDIPSIRVDLRTLVSGASATDIRIRSGDTIYVPRRLSVYAASSRCLGSSQI